ncbi:acyltransferase [Acidocella sp. MX-AZ02]|uniref:acyltransferase family protein n=1 Tax=Acidocella sp. MX-AZ02 TaxID=1214225 RepID=UPI000345D8AC|nr:acyltransferase [Acidocella sp. MX-AZ02]
MNAPHRPGPAKLRTLEIGRFIAASLVMATHLIWFARAYGLAGQAALLGGFVPPAPFAVQFFFTLSGFVMVCAHGREFGQHGASARFWWRRARRVYPMYWLSLLLVLCALRAMPEAGRVLGLVTLAPYFTPDIVPPAWSLRLEIAFYLLFGLCLLPRIGRALLVLWVAGAVALTYWPHLQADLVPQALRAHAVLFLFGTNFTCFHLQFFGGMLAGWLYQTRPPGPRLAWGVLAAGAAALLLCLPFLHWGNAYYTPALAPVLSLGFGAVVLGLAALETAGAIRPTALATRLGAISYPLYILHGSFLALFTALAAPSRLHLGQGGQYALLLGAMLAIYALSAAAAFFIDQPLQRRRRRA